MNNDHSSTKAHEKKGMKFYLFIAFLLVLTIVISALCKIYYLRNNSTKALAPVSKVTIAFPTQINSALMIVANSQGLFKTHGVDVLTQTFLLGKDALKSVLDDKANLAIVADTPFMFAALGGNDVAVVASISQARRSLAIVVHEDRGIYNLEEIKGRSVALTMGSNLPFFLDAMLQYNHIDTNSVNRVDLKTPEVISQFKEGKVDAAVVFQPFLAQLQNEMKDKIKVFYGEEIYAFRFLLVGKKSYLHAHPQEVERILRSLIAANESLHAEPEKARKAIGEVVKVDDAIMTKLFNPEDFSVSLDQRLLLSLEDQARWASQQKLVKVDNAPNFLKFIYYKPLELINSSLVSFPH